MTPSTTMRRSSRGARKRLSEAEREARRAADREFVQQAVEALRSSEGWQRWLVTRRHFHAYSLLLSRARERVVDVVLGLVVSSDPALTLGVCSVSLMSWARSIRGLPRGAGRWCAVRVQRVVPSGGGAESWTVIGADLRPVEPVERYLAWLSRIERAPTTVRAYAHDLKTFWEFVVSRGIEWERVSLEQLGEFTAWLRSPAENVVVLATGRSARASSTVNRILTAVFGFYEFHARHGVDVVRALVDERRAGRGSFKPFLHGIAPSRPRGRVGRLRQERRLPATLSGEQVAAILAAQTRLRDRFLFALLAGTGMRIGQALGLRHCDVVCQERRIEIVAREDNANGARGKRSAGWVPITAELVRLHSDYMHVEYGDLDSDYVFVNLWGGRIGHAMSYHAVDEIVRRTRGRVGFHFTPHQLRHTYATVARRGGVPVEIVSKLLCHRSVRTTSDIYLHSSPEDLRAELERAGVLERLGALT